MARGFETTTGLVIQQGLFEESVTAKHKIGTRVQLADGRVFFYAKAGEALARGLVCQNAALISGHEDVDVDAIVAVGAKTIPITPATAEVTANQYAEGWLMGYETGTEGGQGFKIRSNTAGAIAASVTIETYDPVTVALAATAQMTLIKNPWHDVIQDAAEEKLPVGVPLFSVTSAYYAWLQTWGLANVLVDVACPAGSLVTLGTVAGSVAQIATATNDVTGYAKGVVGTSVFDGTSTLYSIIMLQIHP
jgi:hypothetical protein